MVCHSVDIIVYCDRRWNKDETTSELCRGEDMQTFDKFTRQPAKKAIKFWKSIGWLIDGNRAVCPECLAHCPEPEQKP